MSSYNPFNKDQSPVPYTKRQQAEEYRIHTLACALEDAEDTIDIVAYLIETRDDVTWDPYLSRTETSTPLRGKQQVRAAWEAQVEAVDLRAEPEAFIPVGDHKVVVSVRMITRGSGSGVSLAESVTWVWTVGDDGLAVSVELFASRDAALTAAGRPE